MTLDVVPLREGNMHINVLPFLEPPPLVNLTLETLQFNGNLIEANIGLRHPFLGLTEFTGFDVCGTLISNGSVSGFQNPDLAMPGDGDTRLLNPDGFTRWWNPAEFPVNQGTMFSYNDGLLGTPDSIAGYSATLNGYKYYCDDLGPDDPLSDIAIENRGVFSAGQKNVRHFTIEMGDDGLVFNYAVDASWQFPQGSPPFQAPDDFAPGANRPEAYRVEVTELLNTMWNDGNTLGGDLTLQLDVYDWFNADLNNVVIESPGNFPATPGGAPTGGGEGYSTYEVEITDATPAEGSIDLLITVESNAVDYGGFLNGEAVSVYFTYEADVSEIPINTEGLVALADADVYEIAPGTTVHFNGTNSYDANDYAIVDYEWDFGDTSPTENGEFVNHLFSTADLYYVTLTVENEVGQQDDDIIGIIVCDCSSKNQRHLSATYYSGDLNTSEENYVKRESDHMYLNDYWIMQDDDSLVGFDMTQSGTGTMPNPLNPVIELATGITGEIYTIDCGLDDRVAWASDSEPDVIHIITSDGVSITDIDAPTGEEFLAADFDVDDDLWVVTRASSGAYWAHQYIRGAEDTYELKDTWSHELGTISAAQNVFDIQVLHSTESMYINSDAQPAQNPDTPDWPRSRIDVYDRFGAFIRSYAPYYWSLYPDPFPTADVELDSTDPALEACRLNWYMRYQQPSGYYCNSYRRLTLLLANISINFDQCTASFQTMDLSNISKRLECVDLDDDYYGNDGDQYRYWTTIPSDW